MRGIQPTKTPIRMSILRNLKNYGNSYVIGRNRHAMEMLGWIERVYDGSKNGTNRITALGIDVLNGRA